ncbi:MAG: N-acetyl-alpha-D-glucosaminyl L-malate synthase BshA, partial [Acidobacteria bacterium]|nr:N-acetyl-alpha-D-glucosaminyl L-malate synthase BshA [Acidobacteriota bacterium]
MRIGITCYPTIGGSGAVATELGLELAKRGHEIHVIAYASPFRLPSFAKNVYFHAVDLSATYPLLEYFPYSLALAVKQHEVALRERLDILHVHYAVPHATAGFLAREMLGEAHPLKLITTLHGTDITLVGQEKSFHTVTKFAIERSDAVTTVSSYLKDETIRAFGCEHCSLEVIPNFVDITTYTPDERCAHREVFAPPGTKVLLHMSNFRPLKRVPDVVRIFARVRKEIPAVLVLVGDGPERGATEIVVTELGLEEHVRFLGNLSVVVDVLQAADLFLLPSTTESFGLGALEALACGVPVVATDVSDNAYIIPNGRVGFVVPPDDKEVLSDRICRLLENADLRRELSTAARTWALEELSTIRLAEKTAAVYEAALV